VTILHVLRIAGPVAASCTFVVCGQISLESITPPLCHAGFRYPQATSPIWKVKPPAHRVMPVCRRARKFVGLSLPRWPRCPLRTSF
jgi:hypothetical protein